MSSVISPIEHKEAYTSYNTLYPPHIFNQSVTTDCSEIKIIKINKIPLSRKVWRLLRYTWRLLDNPFLCSLSSFCEKTMSKLPRKGLLLADNHVSIKWEANVNRAVFFLFVTSLMHFAGGQTQGWCMLAACFKGKWCLNVRNSAALYNAHLWLVINTVSLVEVVGRLQTDKRPPTQPTQPVRSTSRLKPLPWGLNACRGKSQSDCTPFAQECFIRRQTWQKRHRSY